MSQFRVVVLLAIFLVAMARPILAQDTRQIVAVETRPGVTVKVLLVAPETNPQGVAVLFPGGFGEGHFIETATGSRLGGNFLVRSAPLFAARGFVAAIVDVPSDHASGMSDAFRTSRDHVVDIDRVLDYLNGRWSVPTFLVGTSRGTISVTFLATALDSKRVAGIVLTATIGVSRGSPPSMSVHTFPLERIVLPTLFVHHRDDGCWASTFEGAQRLRTRMTGSSKVDFIEVVGGNPPRSVPCEAMSAHGFLGKETEVVAAITDWMLGKPVPNRIGP